MVFISTHFAASPGDLIAFKTYLDESDGIQQFGIFLGIDLTQSFDHKLDVFVVDSIHSFSEWDVFDAWVLQSLSEADE